MEWLVLRRVSQPAVMEYRSPPLYGVIHSICLHVTAAASRKISQRADSPGTFVSPGLQGPGIISAPRGRMINSAPLKHSTHEVKRRKTKRIRMFLHVMLKRGCGAMHPGCLTRYCVAEVPLPACKPFQIHFWEAAV